MAVQCVFCEKGTEALNIAVIDFMLQRMLTEYLRLSFFRLCYKFIYRSNGE
jgi:hypothetical protein